MITFEGYRRPDGGVGIRNHVLVIPSVMCSTHVVEKLMARYPEVAGIVHQHGCSGIGADFEQTLRTLAGMGRNPNVASVLIVGLGCESVQSNLIVDAIAATGKTVERVVIQEVGGVTKTYDRAASIVERLLREAEEVEKETFPLSELVVGTECGGSDACSGISANPSLGFASDMIVREGGTVILSETTEFIGAEHILARRAKTPEIKQQLFDIVAEGEEGARRMGVDIRGAQPTPGNMAGGLTTIEEKSLGCIYKGGHTEIQEVISYGSRPSTRGLVIMDTPGNDVESVVGMVAGGAQVVVFTTGRGSPTGSPIAPVIKVASNTPMYGRMMEHMDINAGTIVEGIDTPEVVGGRIFDAILATARGYLVSAERLGHREFAINRIGPSL
jgi:altronate dehydratase large subunit